MSADVAWDAEAGLWRRLDDRHAIKAEDMPRSDHYGAEIAALRRELQELRAWVLEVSLHANGVGTEDVLTGLITDARAANRAAISEFYDRRRETK